MIYFSFLISAKLQEVKLILHVLFKINLNFFAPSNHQCPIHRVQTCAEYETVLVRPWPRSRWGSSLTVAKLFLRADWPSDPGTVSPMSKWPSKPSWFSLSWLTIEFSLDREMISSISLSTSPFSRSSAHLLFSSGFICALITDSYRTNWWSF